MAFSDRLLEGAQPIRDAIFAHPFVQGIGDGTLPVEKFRYYLCQDYVYLIDYCRVFGLAAAKGSDLATMGRLAELLSSTLNVEMGLHRSYSAEFGLGREDLERTAPAPVTHAYTRHLLNVAWSGSLAEIAAVLLPCQWDYWEIGSRLQAEGKATAGNRYRAWIETYASPEFEDLARWIRDLVDSLAERAGPEEQARMEREFLASARYEYLFWDAAWHNADWPL